MSAEITVVLYVDLRHVLINRMADSAESKAVRAIQAIIKDGALQTSSLCVDADKNDGWGRNEELGGLELMAVLVLPRDEKKFSEFVYQCNRGQFPYKTLWLHDSARWQEGAIPPKP